LKDRIQHDLSALVGNYGEELHLALVVAAAVGHNQVTDGVCWVVHKRTLRATECNLQSTT